MRRWLTIATPFALALVLAFGSVGFASSHQAAETDKYVICTGYGLVTITVDAQGNRVAEGVPCPDSIALSAALPAPAPDATFARVAVVCRGWRGVSVSGRSLAVGAWADARAPPVAVFA